MDQEQDSKTGREARRALGSLAHAFIILALIGGSAVSGAGATVATPPARHPRVLILYSNERLLPANIIVDETIRTALAAGTTETVEFYSEFLDVDRFPGEAQEGQARNFLRDKYRDRPPDLIIAGGGSALAFLLKYRAAFPQIPIVHCGVSPDELPSSFPDDRIVGIPHVTSARATLELALRLQPETRHVAVVGGDSIFDGTNVLGGDLSSFRDRISFTWLTNRSLPELRRELSRLPDNSVVLYRAMFRDSAGNTFTPRAALAEIAPASRVPIYGYFDSYLGYGIVGGSMVTFETVGRDAARIGLRILAGQHPQTAVRAETQAATPIFDWRQLRRWKISEERLPAGSVVRFRPPTLWENYKGYLIGGLFIMVGQAVTITLLVVQGRRRRQARHDLFESEQRMELSAGAAGLGIWERDLVRDEIRASDQCRALFGFGKSDRLDFNAFLQRLHPNDREPVRQLLAKAIRDKATYETEYRIVLPDSRTRWIASRARPEFDRDGKPILVRGVSLDITTRKQAEEALQESEARFRAMANTAPVMIWMAGTDKLCMFFNKSWLDFTGRSLDQEFGNGWTEGIHSDDFKSCLATYVEAFDARREFSMDYRLRRADGEYRWVADNGVPRFASDGDFLGYIGSALDITERRLAEETARNLSGRLINAQEAERSRLARELHDDLSQSLALISVGLEMFGQKPPLDRDIIAGRMREFSAEIKNLSSEVHRLSHELHPAKLEQLGLAAAVRGFCKELVSARGIAIEFQSGDVPRSLPDDVALCVYRLTQEALQNVVKHSGATSAKVKLAVDEQALHLLVSDNGHGFDPQSMRSNGSLGIISMRERVRMVRGQISVQSRPGDGTRIEVRVPIVTSSKGSE
jgi:PAS domain S-box-containing protein